jgi:hypothetical protein
MGEWLKKEHHAERSRSISLGAVIHSQEKV